MDVVPPFLTLYKAHAHCTTCSVHYIVLAQYLPKTLSCSGCWSSLFIIASLLKLFLKTPARKPGKKWRQQAGTELYIASCCCASWTEVERARLGPRERILLRVGEKTEDLILAGYKGWRGDYYTQLAGPYRTSMGSLLNNRQGTRPGRKILELGFDPRHFVLAVLARTWMHNRYAIPAAPTKFLAVWRCPKDTGARW